MQVLASLGRLTNAYKGELQALEEVETRFDKAQTDLSSYILQLQEVTTKLNLLPANAARVASMVQMYEQLSMQTRVTVKNVDFSGDYPRYLSGLEADGSLTLTLEASFPSSQSLKTLQFLVNIDKDARIRSIKVLESLLGSLTDVSSELHEDITNAISLQNLAYLLRRVKGRIGK